MSTIDACSILLMEDSIKETFLVDLPRMCNDSEYYWVVAFGALRVALHNHYFDAGRLNGDLGVIRSAALRTASSIAYLLSGEIQFKRQDDEPEQELWAEAESLRYVHFLMIEAPSNLGSLQNNLMPSLREIMTSGTSSAIRRQAVIDSGSFIKDSINVRPNLTEPSLNLVN